FGTYYEIEDRKNRELVYIVDGIDEVVERKPLKIKYESMWDFLAYNEINGKADPKGDYHFWKQQIAEVGVFRTMRFLKALKGASKYKVFGPELQDAQKDQLTSNVEAGFVELQGGQDVQPLAPSVLDPNIFQAEQSARSDIQLISKQAPRQTG